MSKLLKLVKEYDAILCMECGTCVGSCPLSEKSAMNFRKTVARIILGLEKSISGRSEFWDCTTCSTCKIRCPRGVNTVDLIIEFRKNMIEYGRIPPMIRDALENVYKHGNPWGRSRMKRGDWTEDLPIIKVGEQAVKNILFTCCSSAYDSRAQEAARALAKILLGQQVEFGILAEKETCCGNEVYNMGEEGLFELLMEENIENLNKYTRETIITTSPHCYNAFKNRYEGLKPQVKHYTQVLAELVDNGKLKFDRRIELTVTYHDPCYLGKYNGIYEEPRKIIESIPGVKLVEMDRNRMNSLCCEGGGGRMWYDGPPGPRTSEKRITEALNTGATMLVTTCPFCLATLEDAAKVVGVEDKLKVVDLSELLTIALSNSS